MMGAQCYGECRGNVSFLLTDSRSLCFPEETLFFALRSARNDGQHYIAELYQRGVRRFVVAEVPDRWQANYADATFLVVGDTLAALQQLAARHRQRFTIPVVGITGSNGKTMVKEWLYQTLSKDHVVTRSPRSYNSQVGVPLSLWLLDAQTQVAVFEAGISQPGEMQVLHDIIRPTLGVLTMIGEAHQENFPSIEAKCQEKLRLFEGTEALVYPQDDPLVARWQSQAIRASTLAGRVKMLPQPSMSYRRRNCLPTPPSVTVGREPWREAIRCLSSMRPHSKTPSP